MRAFVLSTLALVSASACSSKSGGGGGSIDAPGSGSGSGPTDANGGSGSGSGSGGDDAPIAPDAPDNTPRPLYAVSNTALYVIDVDAQTSTEVADITLGGNVVDGIDGLGFDGTSLIALDQGGADVLIVDPATAVVSVSKPLSQDGLAGLTVIPAADAPGAGGNVYLAASQSTLYRITPSTGHVTAVGDFTDGATFRTDLAWVHGKGLFITMNVPATNGSGGPGTGTAGGACLVKIDPATAATQAVLRCGFDNINGLSGYRGALWAVSAGGNVYTTDMNGMLVKKLMGGPAYTEAAE